MNAPQQMMTKKAAEIAVNMKEAGYGISIVVIIGLITAFITLLKNCKQTPAQAVRRAQKMRSLDKLRMKHLIEDQVDDAKMQSAYESAFHDAAQDLTEADVKTLYTEVA